MKKKSLLAISILLILAACGPASTPTMSSADLANTAIAVAWTSLAMTQAALPTVTPSPTLPPTATITPAPTLALPTLAVSLPNVASPTPGIDPCNEPIPATTKGVSVQVRFVNKSGGRADLSFGMIQKNDLGECGIYSFTIGANQAPTVRVLTGCYWGFAYITAGAKTSTAKTKNNICLQAGDIRGITITAEFIGFD